MMTRVGLNYYLRWRPSTSTLLKSNTVRGTKMKRIKESGRIRKERKKKSAIQEIGNHVTFIHPRVMQAAYTQ